MVVPRRNTRDLRRGRMSIAGARYFVTFCTAGRAPFPAGDEAVERVHRAFDEVTAARDAEILAGTVMPDHVHILFRLGERLSLDRVVAKLKARARAPGARVVWQANYFEHRLREPEDVEVYAWYVFMNPYVAALCSLDDRWPGWWRSDVVGWRFLDLARPGPLPQPEWLGQVKERTRGLVVGDT